MNDTKSCDTCWYEYFDERAYPCSMCIRGAVRTDMFMPKGRQTKAEQTKPNLSDNPNSSTTEECSMIDKVKTIDGFIDILFNKENQKKFMEECKAMGIDPNSMDCP